MLCLFPSNGKNHKRDKDSKPPTSVQRGLRNGMAMRPNKRYQEVLATYESSLLEKKLQKCCDYTSCTRNHDALTVSVMGLLVRRSTLRSWANEWTSCRVKLVVSASQNGLEYIKSKGWNNGMILQYSSQEWCRLLQFLGRNHIPPWHSTQTHGRPWRPSPMITYWCGIYSCLLWKYTCCQEWRNDSERAIEPINPPDHMTTGSHFVLFGWWFITDCSFPPNRLAYPSHGIRVTERKMFWLCLVKNAYRDAVVHSALHHGRFIAFFSAN